ncbi:MAG TPA: hypothetical protein EYO26_01155 [Dehalococcoidia bacterium]|jgi:hypothetical protein|nr:hypothetical protein [Dehalococcoidia bacterium]|tara:strand:- start:623 stop:895 length:273 start_codon:yes stop_codon:yes gene_type:complete
MSETKFDLNISKDMNLLELSTKHVDGNLYFVKTEKNWVADNDSIYVHSLIGFFSELNLLDDNVTKELMNEWGISFRSNSKESDYNSDINN